MREKIIFLMGLLLLTPSFASLFEADNTVVLTSDIDQNAYLAGNIVTVNSINGDLIIGGNVVEINGDVNGDVLAGANTITINGNVNGDVRVICSSLIINGNVSGEVLAGAAQITINNASIGELTVGSGITTINGEIIGNATINSDSVTISSTASIGGFLNYTSKNEATIPNVSQVSGFIQKNDPVEMKSKVNVGMFKPIMGIALGVGFFAQVLICFAITLLSGFVLLKLSEQKVKEFKKKFEKNWLDNSLMGFAVLILVPIAVIIGLITIIAIPLSVFVLMLYAILLYVSSLLILFWLGEKTLKLLKVKNDSLMVELLVGYIVICLLNLIPIIGWLVKFIIWLAGIGLLAKMCKQGFKECKKKKLC